VKERPSELSWSGYEPVAVISKEPEELAAGRKLTFEEGYDDLDSLRECAFRGTSGAIFGLVRYVHAPRPGTQLLVKARSLTQATELLAQAVETLDLTMPDLIWIRQELWAGMSAATEAREAARKAKEGAKKGKAGRAKDADSASPPDVAIGLLKPDAALAKVVGSAPMSRQDVTKRLWAYIKRKGLQDKSNRRMINADDALRLLFGGKPQLDMGEVPSIIDRHVKSKR
jgi:upstream activation factor subunit UAF30